MVFKGALAVKLHAKDVYVGTSSDRKQDQVTMGMVHSPGYTNDESFNFVMIKFHAPVIAPLMNPSQVPVK